MKKLVKLIRSINGCNFKQRETLRSLKLKKIGNQSVFETNPSLLGRLQIVHHLVLVEDL